MKQGHRFVDSDMHIMEPDDFLDTYLDPSFKSRVSTPVHRTNEKQHFTQGWVIDGLPNNRDQLNLQYNRVIDPMASANNNPHVMFAYEAGYDAESFVRGMNAEGVDIAVLFPSAGLSLIARDGMDPLLSAALARAYNDWLHDFCSYCPSRLRMAAMLPLHDVNLACNELIRSVDKYHAAGAFLRPNIVNNHYWHSKYWDPLYRLLEEMAIPLCFHEGAGAHISAMGPRFGENKFMRHVACHPIEMQLATIAMMLGGVFELYPNLKVGYLEAQSWWVPGLIERMQWDLQHHGGEAPLLKRPVLEYWQRNCFSAIEGTEKHIGHVIESVGADNLCVSTDFPHFDSNFPNVSSAVLNNPSILRDDAAKILYGGARLYGVTKEDFAKADRDTAVHSSSSI